MSLADAIRNSVVGGGMLTAALLLALSMPAQALMAWFFLFLFVLVMPGLYLLGDGVAGIVRAGRGRPGGATPAAPAPGRPFELGAGTTSELVAPPSVTEGTTARLAHKFQRGRREGVKE